MRLSKLHIAGFKSFPDRAELGFDQGVTAIVGPNGCGKSNVVDAITWVLGEQSAKSLRGERMEDVIFNGSDARKPTATAEVRLKFTQVTQASLAPPITDELPDTLPLVARDVEIGRRLYRSGESEYLIDGESCRLRDIHDLLMDSGLGVKAYAVIEQGKIGQILASKPAERRNLIEEAAGVTKYKSRRRAAELKLEAAQQNLTRIDDIIFEVEKQRGALKRQASRARRYKRLREELRKWEQVQFARRYHALAKDIEATETRWQQARAQETAADAHVAELETALEGLRLGLVETEHAANGVRERAHARELEIGRRQQQIQFGGQQLEELARQALELAAEVDLLVGRRGPGEQLRRSQGAAAAAAHQALREVADRLAAREDEYRQMVAAVQDAEQESDATRAAVLASSTTLAALRQARDHAAAVRDRVAAELERLATERRDLSTEVARSGEAHDQALQSIRTAREAHALVSTQRAAADGLLSRLRGERAAVAEALGARERALAEAQGRLRSLEELEASRATFGDAARFLLAEAGSAVRQFGAVADHLVVERSFERAVDALLGELLQYVLVESAGDVRAALGLLRERNAGRCGFLVLSETAGSMPSHPPVVVPPGARTLDSVVHVTGPNAKAVLQLLTPALVVQTFEDARALSASVSVPVAASTGEVFRGAWLVQGGSRQDVRGILESRAEMLALRDDVASGTSRVESMTLQISALRSAIGEAEASLAGLVSSQHDQEKALVGLEGQATRAVDERARLARRLEVVETEWSRAEEEQRAADTRREEATSAISAYEQAQREAESNLSSVLGRLYAAREAAEARLRLVTESRAEEAGLIERVAALDADVVRLDEASRELEARIAAGAAEIERNSSRTGDLRASIRESERLLDEDIRVLDGLRVDVRHADETLSALRAEFGDRDHGLRAARHALDGVRAEVMQAEVAKAKASSDLEHLGAMCAESVGSSLDDVVVSVQRMEEAGELVLPDRRVTSVVDEDDDADVATSGDTVEADEAFRDDQTGRAVDPDDAVALLRKRIDRLGPVNMMAIEQFDELETRHGFLTTQRRDLLDSIAQTGEAIQKIDKTTRERFAEAFESINRNFEKTFTTLFGGGRAGLVLIDNENDVESGIDIIAQPPGKRLQNVQLLSGGEKALTAMALMFAIFKHRPSPFCLLDEIDAPLDDANIGRFVEMLQGMQEHTQFILITHNRKTMEIANRLYGVTMEEPGVSKLISLQLN